MTLTAKLSFFAATLFAAVLFVGPVALSADGCYNCASGSSCGNQCRYGSSDTFAARKACEKKGCKITGTSSCSRAANVKVCQRPAAAKKYFWSHVLENLGFSRS